MCVVTKYLKRIPTDSSVDVSTVDSEDACNDEGDTQQQLVTEDEAENTYVLDIWLKKKSYYCLQLEKVSTYIYIVSCIINYYLLI